jgi:hypothetical protein
MEVEVLKPHFEANMKANMVDIININGNIIEVDKETLKEEEVVEVVVEVIEVNNQIVIQIVIIVGNMGTWQRIVIKGSMMHEMEVATRELCIN